MCFCWEYITRTTPNCKFSLELTENDSIEEVSVEELLSIRDAINEMCEVNDRLLLTEEEYPIPIEPESIR